MGSPAELLAENGRVEAADVHPRRRDLSTQSSDGSLRANSWQRQAHELHGRVIEVSIAFILDPIAFSFMFRGLIAFIFSIQGSLCKFFDSQLTQPTKQHLSLTCLNISNLLNTLKNLNTA
jgi:hypothetical protein